MTNVRGYESFYYVSMAQSAKCATSIFLQLTFHKLLVNKNMMAFELI